MIAVNKSHFLSVLLILIVEDTCCVVLIELGDVVMVIWVEVPTPHCVKQMWDLIKT
jgi:hypothetical protein